jgi:regulator of sigma E protease
MIYILFAILMFGLLILVHELGHFAAAKWLGVQVNEFSLGMGPVLWKKQGKETQYSLRLFPIGGFCAMEGEDEDTGSPRAFSRQKGWKRFVILVAGATMNFLTGIVILVAIFATSVGFATNQVTEVAEGASMEGYLQAGDTILSIDGHRLLVSSDFSVLLSRGNGETYDMVVRRDGQKVALDDVPMTLREFTVDGETVTRYGLSFAVQENSVGATLSYALRDGADFVRMVFFSLEDLFTGAAGLRDMAGPIGIVSTMSEVGEASSSVVDALLNLCYFTAFIAVNLAVMNLLPLPALDGGRIFFLVVGGVLYLITGKHLDPKYEGYVHAAGMILLFGLMILIAVNDILRLVM